MKVYYAHHMKKYHTKREERELRYLVCKGYNVVNPRDIEFSSMLGYLNLVSNCKLLICSEFKGNIGKGVFLEIVHAIENSIPVFVLRSRFNKYFYLTAVKSLKIIDRDNWRFYGKVVC